MTPIPTEEGRLSMTDVFLRIVEEREDLLILSSDFSFSTTVESSSFDNFIAFG